MNNNHLFLNFDNISKSVKNNLLGKIILSFDMDWAEDFVIKDTYRLIEKYNIPFTFFLTHDSDFLANIFSNKKKQISFGLHPNFDRLLNGSNSQEKNSKEVLTNIMKIYPNCKFIRSHAATKSGRLSKLFFENGFEIESNIVLHNRKQIPLPWIDFTGIMQACITWEDDHWLTLNYNEGLCENLILKDSLNIFCFHPIHIYLNSPNIDYYNETREFHRNEKELINLRFKGYGIRSILKQILSLKK